jgi:hypothetical protein
MVKSQEKNSLTRNVERSKTRKGFLLVPTALCGNALSKRFGMALNEVNHSGKWVPTQERGNQNNINPFSIVCAAFRGRE